MYTKTSASMPHAGQEYTVTLGHPSRHEDASRTYCGMQSSMCRPRHTAAKLYVPPAIGLPTSNGPSRGWRLDHFSMVRRGTLLRLASCLLKNPRYLWSSLPPSRFVKMQASRYLPHQVTCRFSGIPQPPLAARLGRRVIAMDARVMGLQHNDQATAICPAPH